MTKTSWWKKTSWLLQLNIHRSLFCAILQLHVYSFATAWEDIMLISYPPKLSRWKCKARCFFFSWIATFLIDFSLCHHYGIPLACPEKSRNKYFCSSSSKDLGGHHIRFFLWEAKAILKKNFFLLLVVAIRPLPLSFAFYAWHLKQNIEQNTYCFLTWSVKDISL